MPIEKRAKLVKRVGELTRQHKHLQEITMAMRKEGLMISGREEEEKDKQQKVGERIQKFKQLYQIKGQSVAEISEALSKVMGVEKRRFEAELKYWAKLESMLEIIHGQENLWNDLDHMSNAAEDIDSPNDMPVKFRADGTPSESKRKMSR